MRLLITRPPDQAKALAEKLEACGHEALVDPVLEIVPAAHEAPSLEGVQALLATSANGVRAFAALTERRDLQLLAVGSATAEAAKALGFTNVIAAGGEVERLALCAAVTLDPRKGTLLHIVGLDWAGDLKGRLEAQGFVVRRHVLYAARAAERLKRETQARLSAGTLDGVLFFSPRSALIFVALVNAAGLTASLGRLIAFCLSPAIADAARQAPWGDVRIAARPDEAAMLGAIDGCAGPV